MEQSLWYKNAVFYQVYPISFCDSNGDGLGDLNGITGKLDYLKDLGVNALWLSPFYKSPMDDNGYDISDYRDINPIFGSLNDFKTLLDAAHARNIRVVIDLVVNHSSDEHPWFIESKKSKNNPYSDYYIWYDKPPNKWNSAFGGGAWEYSKERKQYYLHIFSKKQPDLNWENPKVRQEIADICNFWLEMGVDGFRCDVITYIAKDWEKNNYNLAPKWEEYIKELSEKSWSNFDIMTVGECCGLNSENSKKIHGDNKGLLSSVISFEHLPWQKLPLVKFKKKIDDWQHLDGGSNWTAYFENHDQCRIVSRYVKNDKHKAAASKMFAALLLFLKGIPYIYQGQELGMQNIHLKKDEFKDIQSINFIKNAKGAFLKNIWYKMMLRIGRDNARTPVQWDSSPNAGFTSGTPWFKINPNYTEINAQKELNDPDSVLNFYKKAIEIRNDFLEIARDGAYKDLLPLDKQIYFYERALGRKKIWVVANFSSRKAISPPEIFGGTLLLSNFCKDNESKDAVMLAPYETRILLINNE